MGKSEGQKELWHGHVTAVTVAPEYRRLGVAKQLMDSLETVRLGGSGCTTVRAGFGVDWSFVVILFCLCRRRFKHLYW